MVYKLIKELYEHYKDDNFLLSPYSIHVALAMAKEGARGLTLEQMEKALGEDPEIITRETLKVANAIWVRCELNKAWESTIHSKYQGHTKDIRGISVPERLINNWVAINTNNKIKNLLREGQLREDDKLVITNAIHFKDDWLYQFKPANTKKDLFYVTDTNTVLVDMMYLRGNKRSKMRYGETEDLQVLEMLYKDFKTSMVILLPKSRTGSVSYSDIANVKSILGNMALVDVYLPKIKMEFTYDLSNDFHQMFPVAFSDFADFSGISVKPLLKIDSVIHKTFVDINEEGTEAAAATAIVMRSLASMHMPEKRVVFRADHPYVFIIRDRQTNTILFIGGIKQPK